MSKTLKVILVSGVMFLTLNFVLMNTTVSWDISADKSNSLSEDTGSLINKVASKISIVAFYRPESNLNNRNQLRSLLEKYDMSSSKIEFKFLNMYRNKKEVQNFFNSNIDSKQEIFLFAKSGGRTISSLGPYNEEVITKMIARFVYSDKNKILLLSGHGELASHAVKLKDTLKQNLYDLKLLDLDYNKSLLKNNKTLLVLGSSLEFPVEHKKILEKYILNGGRVLVALDQEAPAGLKGLVKAFGVSVNDDVILSAELSGSEYVILGSEVDHSGVSKYLKASAAYSFPIVSAIVNIKPKHKNFKVRPLLRSASQTYITSDVIDKKDKHSFGRNIISSISESSKNNGKLLVIGDVDFLSDEYIESLNNRSLIVGLVDYLIEKEHAFNFKKRVPNLQTLNLNPFDRKSIVALGAVLPIIFMTLTLINWFRRRD